VDHFGNLQLAARPADVAAPAYTEAREILTLGSLTVELSPADGSGSQRTLRCVETFADLAPAELGLLQDSNGHLAVVANQASAAQMLTLAAGELVVLTW
jgi:S-adenosylmethionine hydrolase